MDVAATWFRWMTAAGLVLPTARELANQQQQRAEAAEQRAKELEVLLTEYRARLGEAPQ